MANIIIDDTSELSTEMEAFTPKTYANAEEWNVRFKQVLEGIAYLKAYADSAYENSNAYTDAEIAELIGGAPELRDTLKELSDAIDSNKSLADLLTDSIGKKANQTELETHTGNSNIHVTTTDKTNWNAAVQTAQTAKEATESLSTNLSQLSTNFQAGLSKIATAITNQGVSTQANASPDTMSANIATAATNKYNAGVTATKKGTAVEGNVLSGKTFTCAAGVNVAGTMNDYSNNIQTVTPTAAQTGVATFNINDGFHTQIKVNSANVYAKGVTDADARANTASANYKAGYAAGLAAGQAQTKAVAYDLNVTDEENTNLNKLWFTIAGTTICVKTGAQVNNGFIAQGTINV